MNLMKYQKKILYLLNNLFVTTFSVNVSSSDTRKIAHSVKNNNNNEIKKTLISEFDKRNSFYRSVPSGVTIIT